MHIMPANRPRTFSRAFKLRMTGFVGSSEAVAPAAAAAALAAIWCGLSSATSVRRRPNTNVVMRGTASKGSPSVDSLLQVHRVNNVAQGLSAAYLKPERTKAQRLQTKLCRLPDRFHRSGRSPALDRSSTWGPGLWHSQGQVGGRSCRGCLRKVECRGRAREPSLAVPHRETAARRHFLDIDVSVVSSVRIWVRILEWRRSACSRRRILRAISQRRRVDATAAASFSPSHRLRLLPPCPVSRPHYTSLLHTLRNGCQL